MAIRIFIPQPEIKPTSLAVKAQNLNHRTAREYPSEAFEIKHYTSWEQRIIKLKVLVTQSCLTLFDPMDYSTPGSSVHGTFQARILEWVAIPFSRGSSQPRD